MTKRTITICWLVGVAIIIVGGILTLFCSLALASHIGAATNNFQQGVSYTPDGGFWALVSFIVEGCITLLAGFIVQFVAWIGAVINTNRLIDKPWFYVLLWCGIGSIILGPAFGLGALIWWGLMIAYLVGGPDGTAIEPTFMRATPPEQPKTLAPTG